MEASGECLPRERVDRTAPRQAGPAKEPAGLIIPTEPPEAPAPPVPDDPGPIECKAELLLELARFCDRAGGIRQVKLMLEVLRGVDLSISHKWDAL